MGEDVWSSTSGISEHVSPLQPLSDDWNRNRS